MYRIVDGVIDPREVEAAVLAPTAGAVLTFSGTTRDSFEGRGVLRLSYEAYPEMAEPVMAAIGAEAAARWPGVRVAMAHRTGEVPIGEVSVVIAVSSPHRDACYAASRFAIEALKSRVPVWKKEVYADGAEWKANTPAER